MDNIQLENVIAIIQQITDLLYQENLKPAYTLLAAALPQLEQIIGGIKEEDVQQLILEKLMQILAAMEDQDNTLLADLLQYELLEQLNAIHE